MAKRKRSTVLQPMPAVRETRVPLPPGIDVSTVTAVTERASIVVKSEVDVEVSKVTRRGLKTASRGHQTGDELKTENGIHEDSDSPLSELSDLEPSDAAARVKMAASRKANVTQELPATAPSTPKPKVKAKVKEENPDIAALRDPEAEEEEEVDEEEEVKAALSRPPAVNSSYLPLPWKGRLGYACLNTYLRNANPPVFSSRTCRIASIMERRHPLKDPSMPHHPTKNRPDRDQTPDIARGQAYVEELGLANARDIVKMIRWNDKYGIKFMRLSSEMFPFASHDQYGYSLAPFASEVLAEAGRVAGELGHRLTTHPGQFTQLGSPRKDVIEASIRDLDYHSEMLRLLKLPPQQDRDAVMILHMGGVFGDKEATLNRFRENYKRLSADVKRRLVLENDDVSWSVHELLPICQELNIPLVLDYHHHNIVHSDEVREGTLDIMNLYEDIKKTWTRKGITQKMHYSEPTAAAVTARQRRKHSPRVATLPPCDPTMDLMIEAKDKEQAVFELMRTFKLPGFDRIGDVIPHVRVDENTPLKKTRKKATPKKKAKREPVENGDEPAAAVEEAEAAEDVPPPVIPEGEIGMGGPEGRVYWPPGMEEWLRPPKRVVKKKDPEEADEKMSAKKKRKLTVKETAEAVVTTTVQQKKATPSKPASARKAALKAVAAAEELDEDSSEDMQDFSAASSPNPSGRPAPGGRRQSGRARRVNYAEHD